MTILHRKGKQQAEETEHFLENEEIIPSEKTGDSERDRYIRELAANPEKLNESGNGDIKRVFRLFKKECSAEKTGKRNFRKIGKYTKKMIKKDKKRTDIRHIRRIGILMAVLGIVAAVICDVKKYGYFPQLPRSPGDIILALRVNANIIHNYCPGVELCLIVFALGIVVYLIAVIITKIKDRITARRIVCKAVAENFTVSDVICLSSQVRSGSIEDIADFYPLREFFEVGGKW